MVNVLYMCRRRRPPYVVQLIACQPVLCASVSAAFRLPCFCSSPRDPKPCSFLATTGLDSRRVSVESRVFCLTPRSGRLPFRASKAQTFNLTQSYPFKILSIASQQPFGDKLKRLDLKRPLGFSHPSPFLLRESAVRRSDGNVIWPTSMLKARRFCRWGSANPTLMFYDACTYVSKTSRCFGVFFCLQPPLQVILLLLLVLLLLLLRLLLLLLASPTSCFS